MFVCKGFLKGTPDASPNASCIFHFNFNCWYCGSLHTISCRFCPRISHLSGHKQGEEIPLCSISGVIILPKRSHRQRQRDSTANSSTTNSLMPDVTSQSESMCVLLMAKVSLKTVKHLFLSCSQGFYYYRLLKHCQDGHELIHKFSQHEAPVPYVWQCPKINRCNAFADIYLDQSYTLSLLPHLWGAFPSLPVYQEGTNTEMP